MRTQKSDCFNIGRMGKISLSMQRLIVFFFLEKMETKKSLNTEKGHIIYRQGVMEAKISPNLYENNFSPHIQ